MSCLLEELKLVWLRRLRPVDVVGDETEKQAGALDCDLLDKIENCLFILAIVATP